MNARSRALSIAGCLVVLVLFALWYATAPSERAAIESLSTDDRRALYERTLKTVRTTCNPETMLAGLAAFCVEQAELLVKFPECDAACDELAKPHLAQPTR